MVTLLLTTAHVYRGYEANANGVVNGVLSDIQIQIANQPPRLTSLVSAIINVDAGASVLQEQGQRLVSNGLAIGAADSGIIEDTRSTLRSEGQPTNGGIASRVQFGNGLAAVAAAAPAVYPLPTAAAAARNDSDRFR